MNNPENGIEDRTRATGILLDAIYRELLRASESHDEELRKWHMIRYGCLRELLDKL